MVTCVLWELSLWLNNLFLGCGWVNNVGTYSRIDASWHTRHLLRCTMHIYIELQFYLKKKTTKDHL